LILRSKKAKPALNKR